ncbi:SEC-C metal-binding domain-containing protein [Sphingobacterium lactis]|uniref:SEC-C metal-binding domain-containing protein n=1 Tax=Sphingobacterium lactis TaxID=797291 RepID=UPI003EC5A630
MATNKKFERDFIEVANSFPKLEASWNAKLKMWLITGELDICDIKGVYWNNFNIVIAVPQNYPYCVPIVIEKSILIPRDIDWHISEEGICCLDVSHNLTVQSKAGIHICDFIKEKVYPFFANQLYRFEDNKYAGNEYAHYFEGIIQYYREEHKLPDEPSIVLLLSHVMKKKRTERNMNCPCGSGKKVKHCHLQSIEIIKKLGEERISKDINKLKERLEY